MMEFLSRLVNFRKQSKGASSELDVTYTRETFRRESKVDQLNSVHGVILGPGLKSSGIQGRHPPLTTPQPSIVEEDNDAPPNPLYARVLDSWNPETCVRLLRMPSVQNYSGLRKLIAESDKEWMADFLKMNGLEVLFECVDSISIPKNCQSKLEHTVLLLQCVSCLKAVVSSRNALEFVTVTKKYAHSLADILCSKNTLVKKQLFELLSTLCIFSENGHYLTLDVLESYRVSQKERYRFAILLSEIKQAEVLPYVSTLLALINCIILGASGFRIRTRIRSEFLDKSIWAEINGDALSLDLDFEQMEKLFSQKTNGTIPKTTKKSLEKQKTSQVSFLDSRRSLSICIFLKQFKGGIDELLELVLCNKHSQIGAEKLRTLLQLLPDPNEVKLLKSYCGDSLDFDVAEKFILKISAIENFDSRVEGMLLLEEFPTTMRSLHDHVHSLLDACRILISNEGLKNFLGLVLVHGNYMNSGSYAGNAVGFRLTTLPKLLETRANHPRITLLHYLVDVALKKDQNSLEFTFVLLQSLSKCSRLTVDGVTTEISHLSKSLNRLDCAIKSGDKQLKKNFSAFVQEGKRHLTALEKKMTEIQELSSELAKRFCENEAKFQLEECLSLFYDFCVRIKMAQAENQEFAMNENRRRKQRKQKISENSAKLSS